MKHGFLILLAFALAIGWIGAAWVSQIASIPGLRPAIVFGVLLIAGLTLKIDSVHGAVKHPAASLVSVVMNVLGIPALAATAMLIVPSLGWPPAVTAGFWVAAIVPCTLASAAVWTRRAGGNVAVAMLTTVVTNLLCVATIPVATRYAPVSMDVVSGISSASQITKIAWLVVLPMVLGGLARQWGGAKWADSHPHWLRWLSQGGILIMVTFGGAAGTVAGQGESVASVAVSPPWLVMLTLIGLASVVHLAGLALGWFSARGLGASRSDAIAAAIAGSQKTLMVGLQIAIDLGVSVMPMLIYHVAQLLIDTLVADQSARQALPKLPPDA